MASHDVGRTGLAAAESDPDRANRARRALLVPDYLGTMGSMKVAQSRITGQGQISVPVEVRRRLGLGPGSILEWDVEDEQVVVRRAGKYTSEQIHRALFARKPKTRALQQMDEGIRRHMRKRHAGG